MTSKKTKAERTPTDWTDAVLKAMQERERRGLLKKRNENSYPEALRLIKRMPEFNVVLEKLKKLPKWEDKL